jgi:glycosyltransferase involved in cell wall biosynthesis
VRVAEYQVAHSGYGSNLDHCTAIFTLSPWHSEFMVHDNPGLDPRKLRHFANGVDLAMFPLKEKRWHPGMEDPKFFYSSSPDRGLHHLLAIWPRIRVLYPDALLYVAYGATRWTQQQRWSHFADAQIALDIEDGLAQAGVIDVGVVGARELAGIQLACDIWAYPCDTMQPTETGCITAVEAGASGCPMVITDCDCLPSEFGDVAYVVPLPFDEDEYVDALLGILSNETLYDDARALGRQLAEERSWEKLSERWIEEFQALAS